VLGIMALAALLGPGSGLPRCEAIDYLASNWLVGILALAVGYLMVLLARGAGAAAKRLCGRMGIVSRAVMCGAVLGVVAVFLPDVLFSGQAATGTLIDDWQTRGAIVLLATCAAKICLTQLCVQSGWVGGEFFPLIFCGMCAGYAIAAITGVDAMLPVAMATGAVVGGCTRKPVLTTCVLALCFPLVSLPVVALAAFVAAKIPVPSPKAAEKDAA
jgi:H+/Cl- antiporter ClcA